MNYLHEGLLQLGFDKNEFYGVPTLSIEKIEEKMEIYVKALQEYNAKFDLINTDDHDEIVVRHILDSLSAASEICQEISCRYLRGGESLPQNFTIADIGSGAGLPGIPLATIFPQFNFTLLERMTKRCGFLSHVKEILSLKNVTVLENQAERIEQESFNICVFRAFRPLEKKMTKVLRRIVKSNGFLAAYKAKSEKIEEEMNALGTAKPNYVVRPLTVPFLTENTKDDAEERERNLVIIEKN